MPRGVVQTTSPAVQCGVFEHNAVFLDTMQCFWTQTPMREWMYGPWGVVQTISPAVWCNVFYLADISDSSPWKVLGCVTQESMSHTTFHYWIALGEKTSVYRGTQGSRRCACGPNENLNERLSSRRWYVSHMTFVLILFTNCEVKIRIVMIQYKRNSIIAGPAVLDQSIPNI